MPANKTTATKTTPASALKVRVRMYRQGLGDCHLVSFHTADKPVHMLIDCGTLGATTTNVRMADVVADIAAETEKHLHLLISTHEHHDHVSGFGSERAAFDAFQVDHVWQAWTENADDDLAREVAKYKGDLVSAVALAANALAESDGLSDDQREAAAELRAGIHSLLGFVGDVPDDGAPIAADFAKTVHDAMAYVTTRAGKNVEFLSPGTLIERPWLPGLRFYVLGPPRKIDALKNTGEHGSPDLYEFGAELTAGITAAARFRNSGLRSCDYLDTLPPAERESFEHDLPFDSRYRVEVAGRDENRARFPAYYREEDAWRRIDHDWLAGGSDLALQLDNYTNNTSLALAIELVADGRVLLFPADAQLGNWLSWHDYTWQVKDHDGTTKAVTATDLLKRTVFYKAGHHASHNATLTDRGLELMKRPDLVALIPLDRAVALKKTPPWLMPAEKLYQRLVEKTQGRVLRSDTGWPEDKYRPSATSAADWASARTDPRITIAPLYIEFRLT